MIDYSVVVPVFNSADSLKELTQRLVKVFESISKTYEIIMVEDAGTDNSWQVIKDIKQQNPENIKAIKLNKNFGQHNATMCGFNFAKGDRIITIDDDLQNPPEEIHKLISTFEENDSDIAYGIYTKKQHDFARNVLSSTVKKTNKLFMKGSDKGSSFRLISSRIVKKLLEHQITFIFIDEVMQWYTDKISFVVVEHKKREHNKSGYSPMKLFKLASDLTYFYTNIPLKLMVYGGMIISFLTFLMAVKFVIQKIFFDVPLGYTSVIVAILFSTSIIVFSLGVIGGYLSRIQIVQNRKPQFEIDVVLD